MSDIKTLTTELNKTIEEFKNENDKRFKKLESGEYVDPLIEEHVNKANAAITDLSNQINERIAAEKTRTDELEQEVLNLKQMGLGGGRSDDAIKDEIRLFKNLVDEPAAITPDAYKKYRDVFDSFVRRGLDKNGLEIQNAMSVGSDPDGGYWVPTSVSQRIITKLFETSPMRRIANIETIGTDEWEAPKDVTDGTSGGWVGETESRTATSTPTLGVHKIPVHEQYAEPKATQKLLSDSTRDVESWLVNKTTDKMVRTENTAFVSGTGNMQPRGFTDYSSTAATTVDSSRSWGVLQYIITGASGGFKWTDSPQNPAGALIDCVYALNKQYRTGAVWCMNSLTLAEVRKLRDANGNYFLIPNVAAEGVTNSLLGYRIEEMEDMADISADSFSVAFGNFNIGYQIVDRHGFRMIRDNLTDKPHVLFYMYRRVGGDVVNFDAIKLLKFGTS